MAEQRCERAIRAPQARPASDVDAATRRRRCATRSPSPGGLRSESIVMSDSLMWRRAGSCSGRSLGDLASPSGRPLGPGQHRVQAAQYCVPMP
ncbi:hypothetical protein SAMD00023353_0403070 [Rosellinia necatrix]|uniref:Uncharacterized protein n=1 Tax=Rosellinia necatrix TaxID=77044 RepID=A0A1S8A5H7_ROSNE|nr:hypothetical protein SAMD00023353_0403070 [Rosellinia necatrix]